MIKNSMICNLIRILQRIGKLVPVVWLLEIYAIARTIAIVLLATLVIFNQLIMDTIKFLGNIVSNILTF